MAASTVPSSPQSAFRASSLFDGIDSALDSSRPTSPESVGYESPFLHSADRKRGLDVSHHNLSISTKQSPRASGNGLGYGKGCESFDDSFIDIDTTYFDHATILEEPEDDRMLNSSKGISDLQGDIEGAESPIQPFNHPLRRSTSHESILSKTTPDFPTLRKSQHHLLTTGRLRAPKSRTSLSVTSPRIEPVISSISMTATAANPSGQDSKSYNRSILSGISNHSQDGSEKQTLGKRVGGWVWGKWGVAPTASTGDLRTKAALSGALEDGRRVRSTGVNQHGRIKGIGNHVRAPSQVEAQAIDEGALREVLGEG